MNKEKLKRTGYRKFVTTCNGKTFIVLIHGTTNICLIRQKRKRNVISATLGELVNHSIQLEYGTLNL